MSDKQTPDQQPNQEVLAGQSSKATPASPLTPPKSPRVEEMYQTLLAEKKELEDSLSPIRKEYDTLVTNPRIAELGKVIKETSAKLAAVNNELAAIARRGGARGIEVEPGQLTSTSPETTKPSQPSVRLSTPEG